MRCGGVAKCVARPTDEKALITLLRFLGKENIHFKLIGGMTNTLPCDGTYDGVIVKTTGINFIDFTEDNTVTAGAGALLATLITDTAEKNIGGFEELSGIPGTVGGSVFGNSGTHSVCISDLLVSVRAYDSVQDIILELPTIELEYGYRESLFKRYSPRFTIISAKFRGIYREKSEILGKIRTFVQHRRERQPLNMPSLGSVFKHPKGDFAPRLIESLSLKGLRFGGALVSEKHAGFIVNCGNATATDVKELILIIKDRVRSEYGIVLEEEIDVM